MKISDKIESLLEMDVSDPKTPKAWYSYEYFPPKTAAGEENLVDRIGRMATTNPLWMDVTWGAGGSSFATTLDLCAQIQRYMGVDVLMHLTCTGMTRDRVTEALDTAKEYGIKNILALRGDPPQGQENWEPVENGFAYATQLVEFIKEKYGDYFCIVVAGYPETHLQATSREDDIKHLKEKCDAGADIVITQMFYNNQMYLDWVKDCKAIGIKAHFVPGLMPILGYDRFKRSIGFCKTNVPQSLSDALEPLKADDEKVRNFGVDFGVKQCQELMEGGCRFLHFYTMNLEAATIKIIEGLGIMNKTKQLPFMQSNERKSEDVRPIFWAIKPQSYRLRTEAWDEFPNGRWGVSRSPAFGSDDGGFVSYSKKFKTTNHVEKKKNWGETCTSFSDVSKVFVAFLSGKIKKFPFAEGALSAETDDINQQLLKLNENKLFTINSQPRVNAAKSTDPKFGWGPENGYVYQKAYVEFFVHKDLIKKLVDYLSPQENITYQAISASGEQLKNVGEQDVNAVTWGVFKGKEIVQPTVVDHQAFEIWKDEAFKAWNETWAVIYTEEESKAFLKSCHDDMYLVNVVDNDFVGGDLYDNLLKFVEQNQETINKL